MPDSAEPELSSSSILRAPRGHRVSLGMLEAFVHGLWQQGYAPDAPVTAETDWRGRLKSITVGTSTISRPPSPAEDVIELPPTGREPWLNTDPATTPYLNLAGDQHRHGNPGNDKGEGAAWVTHAHPNGRLRHRHDPDTGKQVVI